MRNKRSEVWVWDLCCTVPYYTAELCAALNHEHVDVTLISGSYYLDPSCFGIAEKLRRPGLLDIAGKARWPMFLRRAIRLAESLVNLSYWTARLIISPPTVIHVQYLSFTRRNLPFEEWFLQLADHLGVRIIYTVHDLLPHDTGLKYKKRYEDIYRRSDLLICHSHAIKRQLEAEYGCGAESVRVIPHGPLFYGDKGGRIPLELESLPSEELVLLCQGLIFPYKGIDFLIRAWTLYKESGGRGMLIIAGTGAADFLQMIENQRLRSGVADSIVALFRFLTVDELVGTYARASAVVYPYRQITTSGALLTGLSRGKAIIATDLAPFREIISNGVNGLLVSPDDHLGLAEAIRLALENRQIRAKLESEVRRLNFGSSVWREVARETTSTYTAISGLPHHR